MNVDYVKSLAEKIVVAFGVAFLGAVTAAPITDTSVSSLKALALAGIAAGFAAVAGLFSKPLGANKSSANKY